jgi:hypothetical protein
MKAIYLSIFGLFFFCCCNVKKIQSIQSEIVSDTTFVTVQTIKSKENELMTSLDLIKKLISEESKISIDTLKYQFSVKDIGTEGNEGTAYYVNNELRKIKFDIYTSMWKISIQYLFIMEQIYVCEDTYNTFENKHIKNIVYVTNLNGVPLMNVDSSRVNVFQQIKDVVPFKLH